MTSTQYLHSLQLVHKVMIFVAVLFSIIVGWMVIGNGIVRANAAQMHSILKYVTIAVSLGSIVASVLIYKMRVDNILNSKYNSLSEKLAEYKSAVMTRYMMLEVGIVFNVIALLLTSQYYYLVPMALLFILFMLYAPNRVQIASHLQLPTQEAHIVFDEYGEIE